MAQKISYWLIIALVLSLGFGQLLRLDFYGVPLFFHDVLVVCILALQGLTLKEVPNPQIQRREGQTLMALGLKVFLFAMAIGWLHALAIYPVSDLLVPALYALRILAYLALYIVIISQKLAIPYPVFLLSGIFTLTIGYLQYYLTPDMRIFQYLGWDDHMNRLTLPHFDPTFTGVMLSLFLFALIKNKSIFHIPVLLFTSLGILLTYSRSVWLSLGITLVLFIRPKKVLLVLIPILLAAILLLPKRFGEGTNLLRTYSITSRFESDLAYVRKYNWELLIGRGMNTLPLDTSSTSLPNHATGPNNSYLYLLTTTGVLGLVGWGMFMWSLYAKSTHRPMLLFFFLASLFNNVMFYPFALLWILLNEV